MQLVMSLAIKVLHILVPCSICVTKYYGIYKVYVDAQTENCIAVRIKHTTAFT